MMQSNAPSLIRSDLATRPWARRLIVRSVVGFAALGAAALAQAAGTTQPADAAPASAPGSPAATTAPASDVPIFVREVAGNVRVLSETGGTLTKLEPGTVLKPGAEILTGVRSLVRLQIGAGQIFTIDRQSRVKLSEVLNVAGTEKTTIELPYGRITFDVTSTQFANDVKIQAPDATLAVKGTTGGMEVTPGQPTRAFGGDLNTGRFEVRYDTGRLANVTGSEATNKQDPAPANVANTRATTDAGNKQARDPDETKRVAATSSAPQTTGSGAPERDQPPVEQREALWGSDLEGETFYELVDSGSGAVVRLRDRFGNSQIFRDGIAPLPGLIAGATLIANPINPGQQLLMVLANVVGPNGQTPTLFSLNLADPNAKQFIELGAYSEQGGPVGNPGLFLQGLASLGPKLYSIATSFSADMLSLGTIAELPLAGGNIATRMVLGVPLYGGLAASDRGSIFVLGEQVIEPSLSGSSQRAWLLFELDPRTNYLVNGWAAAAGAFNNSAGTATSQPGLSFNSIAQVTGLAYVGNRLVITGVSVQGQVVTVQYNPSSVGANVERVDTNGQYAFGSLGFAGGSGANAPASTTLTPATSRIEFTSINPVYAQMAYSTAARQSGVVGALLREQILATARDPAQCLASGALVSMGQIASRFDGQTAGFGQSIAAFRDGLDAGHPCLPIVIALSRDSQGCSCIRKDNFVPTLEGHGSDALPVGAVPSVNDGIPGRIRG
jgi:hypothetical protein